MRKTLFASIIHCSIILLFVSCATNIPIQKTAVMTAYMSNSNLKYYIRPTRFQSDNYESDKSYTMLDFTYQMKERNYVTDAYVNFSLYYETICYINEAFFVLKDGTTVPLTNITVLDRDTTKSHLRVSTVLEKTKIQQVLTDLCYNNGSFYIILDDKTTLHFFPTPEGKNRISDVFSK